MENKKTVIDLRKALMHYEVNTGEKKTYEQLSKEHEVSTQTLYNWTVKDSKHLKLVLALCNETGLTIQQIIKQI